MSLQTEGGVLSADTLAQLTSANSAKCNLAATTDPESLAQARFALATMYDRAANPEPEHKDPDAAPGQQGPDQSPADKGPAQQPDPGAPAPAPDSSPNEPKP